MASSREDWQLKTRFSLPTALQELRSVPADVSGLMALAEQLKKAQRTTKARLPVFKQAVVARARELLDNAQEDFVSQVQRLDEAQGLGAVRAMEGRLRQVLQQVGLARESAGFKGLADAEIERRVEGQLRAAETLLREQPEGNLLATLDLGATVRSLHQTLLRHGAQRGAEGLEQLVAEEIARRLEGDALRAAFAAELKAVHADSRSLPGLLAMGEDLASLAVVHSALPPYVDQVADRVGEILDASLAVDLDNIKQAGRSVFDVPDLLAELDDLASWYSEWGAVDLAAEIREAGLGRIADLAKQGFAAYARDIGQREVTRVNIRQLERELAFFRGNAAALGDAAEYTKLAASTLERMQTQLSADLLKRLGLPPETRGLGVSVAGHRVDLGTFAENLAAAGHELVGGKASACEENAMCLTSLTIDTKSGVAVTIGGGPTGAGDAHFSGSLLKVGDKEEVLYPNEWVTLMLQLGAIVPSGAVDAAGVADSDRFASDPLDPRKVVEQGVFAEDLVHDVALEAALGAIEQNPEEPRFYYHAGRVLLAMGKVGEARAFLERAHADGYPAAAFTLGGLVVQSIMSLGENQMPKISDLREAKKLFDAASASGYAVAADQSAMVSELMAGMTPKFAEGFKKPDLMEAIYSGRIDRLLRAPERTRTNYRYYFSSLRAAVAAKHRGFERSSLNRDIHRFAPQIHKDSEEMAEAVTEGGLKGLLKGLRKYQEMGTRALKDGEVWKIDPSYPQGAGWDGMLLMMYVGHDERELHRVFENVLRYLRQAPK